MTRFLTAAAFGSAMATTSATFAPVVLGADAKATSQQQVTMFKVENMTCALCPITAKTAMKNVDGGLSVTVDLDIKTATVTVTYDLVIATPKVFGAASADARYPAVPST